MLKTAKKNLQKLNNKELFDVFKEHKRFNLEAQTYAGNLLFERGFDINNLKKAKNEVIENLKEVIDNKFQKTDKKIIIEYKFRGFFITLLTVISGLIILQISLGV